MKRKILSLILALCMIISVMPIIPIYAEEELISDDLTIDPEYDNYYLKNNENSEYIINPFSFSAGYPNTHTNTGNQAYDIAQIAKTQIGYTETGDNHTKYNNWFYGSDTSAAWCAIFICWCANQAGIPTSTIALNAQAGDIKSSSASNKFGTPTVSFSSHTPQIGDIIFVDNTGNGVSNHVGLVVDVDSSYIYTVEGNYSDKVSSLTYSRSNGYRSGSNVTHIVAYGTPQYTITSPPTSAPDAKIPYFTLINHGNYTDVRNNTNEVRTVTVIVAGYDEGILREITASRLTFNAGETHTFIHNSDECRIFVWDSLNGMRPLAVQ
ncbi:MAG: CHAP domain-containing protein [Oscillospiraceae bacterium]|nr:CHAP domain-containing protein [Oscillospiraceae bacterium]